MTFRSLQMQRYQLILPRQSAYITMDRLGQQNKLHIIPNKKIADRPFHQMVKRCDESLQKIDVLIKQMQDLKIQFDQYDEKQSLFMERCHQIWKQQAIKLGVDQPKLFDVYQNQLNQQFQEFQSLMQRLDKMKKQKDEILQTIACLQTINEFFSSDGSKKRQSMDYYVNNIAYSDAMKGVSYIVGVIQPESQMRLSKMIYRVSRGYACTKTLEMFKYQGLRGFDKKVMLIIYPTSDSTVLQRKLKKVIQTFSDRYFIMNQIQSDSMPDIQKYKAQDIEIQNIWEMTSKQFLTFMNKIKDVSYIEKWRVYLWKERILYDTLGQFQSRQQFYFGQMFVPSKDAHSIQYQLQKIVPTPTMYRLALTNPPTAFNTNDYTAVPQQIVDTYGVPRYQEMNPSIFTTVTFPFFFGVMFGDIAHGGLIFFLGLYLIFNNDRIKKSKMKFLCQLRYMVTMMGFFAFYCGFVYNDIIGFNINLFNSCYNPPPHQEGQGSSLVGKPQYPRPDCVYPFGLDPIWGRAQNQLNYTNSLKMKLSVIIAIIHMTFGILLKATNARFFRKPLDFYFQFLPQVIFMVLLFGYMDFLIIFKWLQPWDVVKKQGIPPQQWAPSIITTMMNVGLKMGQTSDKPDGTSSMWGQLGNSSQDTLQLIILAIAFICVPIMLLPKPIIQIREHKKTKKMAPLRSKQEIDDEDIGIRKKLNSGTQEQIDEEVDDGHSPSQIFVHQLIQTIQFVLGAVSNTASYLRLWALSLAHGQLAKVFYDYTVGLVIGVKYIQLVSMIGGFWLLSWITFGIIICMDSMECFLHSLRLHWVQFQNKFFKGDGYKYHPYGFQNSIIAKKDKSQI